MVDEAVDDRAGQPGDLRQQAEAARGDRGVQRLGGAGVAQRAGHDGEFEEFGVAERVQFGERFDDRTGALGGRLGDVVADDQLAFRLDAGDQFLQLEGEQPAVRAELDDVLGDFRGDPADHFQALGDRGDVADRHQVLDLQGGEGAGDLVQAELVALQGRQRLVGAGEDRGRLLQDAALAVHIEGDQAHRLADGDDREAGLDRDALGGAVAGAGLLRGDGGVRDQLDSGPHDFGDVLVEDQRTVELAQFAQPGRGELDVEDETAGTHGFDGLVEAQHDQPARIAAEDALQAVAQGRTGRDGAQRGAHQALGAGTAAGPAGSRCPVVGCHCTPPSEGLSVRRPPGPCRVDVQRSVRGRQAILR